MKASILVGLVVIITVGFIGTATAMVAPSPTASLSSVTVVDDLNRTVVITSSERIVAIAPSCTEIVYALGLGDRVIAVDVFSDYPPEAIAKQRISSVYFPDPEEVAALNPDLVVYYYWGPFDPTVERLSSLGLTVIALYPKTIDDILEDIILVGRATGKLEEAEALVSRLRQRIDEIRSRTANVTEKPRVYMEFFYPPPWTCGPGSWAHQLIEMAGGVNAFEDAPTPWVQTTDEEVIARNPDVIIRTHGYMGYATLEDFRRREGWGEIKAVANGAVYLMDEDLILPGPRIVDGLEVIARILHPELFGGAMSFTFPINSTLLRTGIQHLEISGPMDVNIYVVKAFSDCILTVSTLQAGPSPPPNRILVEGYLDIRCSVPEGLAFILRIYYTEDKLRRLGVREDSLKIYVWEDANGGWVALDSAVNRDMNYVEAVVTHLSYFALMGEPTPFWEQPIPLWLFISSLIILGAIAFTWAYISYRRARVTR